MRYLLAILVSIVAFTNNISQEKVKIEGDLEIDQKIIINGSTGLPGQILSVDENGNPKWIYYQELGNLPSSQTLQGLSPFDVGISAYHTFLDDSGSGTYQGVTVNKPKIRANVMEFDRITNAEYFMNKNYDGPGSIDFTLIDAAAATTASFGKKAHAHALIYHLFHPDWLMEIVRNDALTILDRRTQFEQHVLYYVTEVVGQKKAQSYDVANEIFAFNNFTEAPSGDYYSDIDMFNPNIRDVRLLYADDEAYMDFLVTCFEAAHVADPDAILFYNENDPEQLAIPAAGESEQFARLYATNRFLDKLAASSVPSNRLGIGVQFHTNLARPMAHLEYVLNSLKDSGFKVHISELDVSVNYEELIPMSYESGDIGSVLDITAPLSPAILEAQRQRYKDIVIAYKSIIPVGQAFGITVWDLCDGFSWLASRPEWPTLFDSNFDRKPAYDGFKEGLVE